MNSKAIVSGAIILFIGNMLSSVLGLTREVILAARFGAGVDTDAYLFALAIPAFFLSFMSGIFSSGFIPLYIKEKVDGGEDRASLMYSNTINWTLILLAAVMGLSYLFSGGLSDIFALDEGSHAKIMHMLWILLPSMIFFTLSYAQSVMLSSVNHFTLPAFLTVINNLVVIAFVLLFDHAMGIYSMAVGYVIGTVFQFVAQIPVMRKHKLKYRFYLSAKDETIRRLTVLSIPIASLVLIDQCTSLASRYFAANLEAGSTSAINYATRILLLPVTLFGTAIVNSTFPSVLRTDAENKREEHESLIAKTVKSMLLILVPVMVLCMMFSRSIVSALLERGAFDAGATRMTATAFTIIAVGIVMTPLRDFFVKLLLSKHRKREPVICAGIYCAVFIAGCFLLVPGFQYKGIVVSSSAALIVSFGYIVAQYKRLNRGAKTGITALFLTKVAFSSAVAAAAAWAFDRACPRLPFDFANGIVKTSLTLVLGLGFYVLLIKALRIEEVNFLYDKLLAKFHPGRWRKRRPERTEGESWTSAQSAEGNS